MLRSASLAIGLFLLAAFVHAVPLAHAQEEETFAISGVVVNDEGEPVPGAYVYGSSMREDRQWHDKNVTDEDGRFTLRLGPGRGELSASHPAYREGAYLPLGVDGDESGLRLVLPTPPPRTAVVEGRVLDAQGNPIEGAQVTLGQGCCYAMETAVAPAPPSDEPVSSGGGTAGTAGMTRPAVWHDGDHQTATTGPDGAYRFETYPGPRQVTAHAKGYAQSSVSVEAIADQAVRADLTLHKVPAADAVLVVRVVDAKTGAPIRGAGVSLQNAEWSHYAWAETGADGAARLTTVPGWSIVNVHHYAHADVEAADGVASDRMRAPGTQYYAYAKALRLASGEQALDARLEPKPAPTVVLTGYVVDPDKETGVPGAQVSVWNQDTGDWGGAKTDATGSYRLVVRPGHYTMNAWAEGHLPGVATFSIADGEAAKRVDVEAPEGEQRYAHCIDGCPEPMPLVAEDAAKSSVRTSGASTAGAPAAAGEADARDAALATGSSQAAGDATRAAAYEGSGGGLPPYDPDATDAEAASTQRPAEVPALGIGAALVALGLLALARRR